MNVTCTNCQTIVTIADHKLPPGKKVSLLCPKCKGKIYVTARAAASPGNRGEERAEDGDGRFLNLLNEDIRVAMLCAGNPATGRIMEKQLRALGYKVVAPPGVDKAFSTMKFQRFDLVAMDDLFDHGRSGEVLDVLTGLDMLVRRRIFVIHVTDRARTRDNMAAFHRSVNLIINPEHLEHSGKLISQALVEHEQFYKVFFESMKEVGKA